MDPRCPGLYLFEVNADIGISSSEIYEPKNITDEVAIPPPELMPSNRVIRVVEFSSGGVQN